MFGESFGKTTEASVNGKIKQGVQQSAEDKYTSMSQSKYTNQSEMLSGMQPANVFEPGFDCIGFTQPDMNNTRVAGEKSGLTMSYQEVCEAIKKQ